MPTKEENQKEKRIREIDILIRMKDRNILNHVKNITTEENEKNLLLAELGNIKEGKAHCNTCKHKTGGMCFHPKVPSALDCIMNKPMYKYFESK